MTTRLPLVFYPSVACRMVMRFDEALLAGNTAQAVAPDEKAKAVGKGLGVATGQQQGLAAGGKSTTRIGIMSGASDRLTHVVGLVPTSASIELPSYRQATKFSLTFAFKDFPIDPRALRALGVDIYLGVVNPKDFADGLAGLRRQDKRLASQLILDDSNLMLAGLVDNITSEFNERGSEVRMDGRGFQGLLLDTPISAETLKTLNLNQPLDAVIKSLLNLVPQGNAIPVKTQGWVIVPKPYAPEILSRVNKGRDGQQTQMGVESDPNDVKVWDLVTKICFVVGAVPYFQAHTLWLRPARDLFDQKNAGITGDTPFKNGVPRSVALSKGSVDINFRKMVYGRNLDTYKIERKFGGRTVPTVRVVCVDTSATAKGQESLLKVVYPAEKAEARRSKVAPNGSEAATEYLNIPVKGIVDKTRLLEIAKQVYEEVSRGELGGMASTKDLASLGGDNGDVDMLRLRPGDAVEFVVDAGGLTTLPPVATELNNQAGLSDAGLVADLQNRLDLDADLAKLLVGTARGRFEKLQNVFRVANVKYSWDLSKGIGVDFDFQNYVTARNDVEGFTESLGDVTTISEGVA